MGTLILKVAVAGMCEMYELFYGCQATEFFQIFCSGLPCSAAYERRGVVFRTTARHLTPVLHPMILLSMILPIIQKNPIRQS